MKKLLFSLSLLFVVVLAACQQKTGGSEALINENVKVEKAAELLASKTGLQVLDVRTPGEFTAGSVQGAKNIDIYDPAFRQNLSALDKNQPVLVYCKSGGRSAEAAGILKELGFREVYNMEGGMLAWTNAGKPVNNAGAVPKTSGLNQEAYLKLVAEKPLVLVDFHAAWCMPCKKLAPILAEIVKKQSGNLTLIKIDADENPDLMKAKQIQGIPYLELYRDGKLAWSNMGMTDEATILSQLK